MKRIYISGPMTGLPGQNHAAFHQAAQQLRAQGYDVVNPADTPVPSEGAHWEAWMKADLVQMLTCDTVALLPGWEASKGAHLELHVAHRVGMNVVSVAELHRQELEAIPA